MTLSLEQPEYVAECLARWATLPKSMIIIEFKGDGDPMFGGSADDRFVVPGPRVRERGNFEQPVEYDTIQEAHEAAKLLPNRRENSLLGVSPIWR